MNDVAFYFFAILAFVGFCLSVWSYVERRDHQRRIDYFYVELKSKTSDTMYEFERSHRRELQEELQALKDYLEIKSVKTEPSVRMVKKGAKV